MKTPRFVSVGIIAALFVSASSAAQPSAHVAPISAAEIDAHLKFLSSDLLEGRAPATRGGRLAAEYIASQLRASGVEPASGGSYFQQVPIDVVTADRSSMSITASGKAA